MTIGYAVKTVRKKRGIGQQALAKRLKISQGFLSLVEKGQRVPSFNMTKRLADALHVPIELLLLMGCATPRARHYSKQIHRITALSNDILSEIAPLKP